MPEIAAGTAAHVREHGSMLADAEGRLLRAIARRMPRRIGPDHLSAIGFAGMVVSAAAFVIASRYPAAIAGVAVGLGLNWFGDSLDGTVARVRNEQRPRYGYYLDHVLDIVGMAVLLAGMGASTFMSAGVALLAFAAFVALMAESFLATHAVGTFRLSIWRIGPTELRILLALGTLWLLRTPHVTIAGRPMLLFDAAGVCAAAGMAAAFVFAAARNAAALYRAEPRVRSTAETPHATAERRPSTAASAFSSRRGRAFSPAGRHSSGPAR